MIEKPMDFINAERIESIPSTIRCDGFGSNGGFGVREAGGAGSRAVLEIRGRDVPFILRHGQAVAKLVFEPMAAKPDIVYGAQGSHYQSQGLRLSKHFNSEV